MQSLQLRHFCCSYATCAAVTPLLLQLRHLQLLRKLIRCYSKKVFSKESPNLASFLFANIKCSFFFINFYFLTPKRQRTKYWMRIYLFIYACIFAYISVCTYLSMHVFMHVFCYVHIYLCMHIFSYAFIYLSIFIYAYIYAFVSLAIFMSFFVFQYFVCICSIYKSRKYKHKLRWRNWKSSAAILLSMISYYDIFTPCKKANLKYNVIF